MGWSTRRAYALAARLSSPACRVAARPLCCPGATCCTRSTSPHFRDPKTLFRCTGCGRAFRGGRAANRKGGPAPPSAAAAMRAWADAWRSTLLARERLADVDACGGTVKQARGGRLLRQGKRGKVACAAGATAAINVACLRAHMLNGAYCTILNAEDATMQRSATMQRMADAMARRSAERVL